MASSPHFRVNGAKENEKRDDGRDCGDDKLSPRVVGRMMMRTSSVVMMTKRSQRGLTGFASTGTLRTNILQQVSTPEQHGHLPDSTSIEFIFID